MGVLHTFSPVGQGVTGEPFRNFTESDLKDLFEKFTMEKKELRDWLKSVVSYFGFHCYIINTTAIVEQQ